MLDKLKFFFFIHFSVRACTYSCIHFIIHDNFLYVRDMQCPMYLFLTNIFFMYVIVVMPQFFMK